MTPDLPPLLPAVNVYCTCADEHPANVIVAVPTCTVAGAGFVAWSNTPPVVS